MKKFTLILAAPLLSSCATLAAGAQVHDSVCQNAASARTALLLAEVSAQATEDKLTRTRLLAAIKVSLAVLDTCPGEPVV